MSWSKRFVELGKAQHDRNNFDCGSAELNNFLKTQAAKHMASGISRTLVLPARAVSADGKQHICAFYTIAASSISRSSLPDRLAKKLPHHPVPVFVLAQMAVNTPYQGQGLGRVTLITALKHFVAIQAHMRAYAVVVDCLTEDMERFYAKYGFETLCIHQGRVRMYLPMRVLGQLFSGDLAKVER
ncbi:MAG: GNAT family N-acetyltransferase [Mariprofundaceae bacterium]|nr:GNAT family N-acetyltransferase [Mariprofundaceae bacterium]